MAVIRILEASERRGRRYRVEWYTPDGSHRSRTFSTRKAAEAFAHRVELEKAEGVYRDPSAAKVPLAERARAWLEGRHDLRPSTRAIYDGVLRLHVLPRLGDRPIGSIRPEEVRSFVSGLLEAGVGRRTAQIARQVLGAILEEAARDGVIPANPVRLAPAPRLEHRELRVPTPEDVERLVDALPERWRPLVMLAAWGGLRWGEVAGLRVGDVDVLGRRVRISRQAVEAKGGLEVRDVKTAAGRRTVALPSFVAEALAQAAADRGREEPLFPNSEGGVLGRRARKSRVWRPAVRAARLEGLRFHDLRHFAATVAVAAGAHPRALQARLGHSSSRVTMDVYASVLPGLDEELARRLEEVREEARRRALEGGRVLPLRWSS